MIPDPRSTAFEDCLQRVLAGESPEQAVQRYPAYAEQFRPLLAAALQAARLDGGRLAGVAPVPLAAQQRSKARLLAAARQVETRRPLARLAGWLRAAALASVVLVLLAAGGAGAVSAAAAALPGDLFYPLKRAAEQAQYYLAAESARPDLQTGFEQNRLREIHALIAAGRSAAVSFRGGLEQLEGEAWMVAGVPVRLNAQTALSSPQREQPFQTGDLVEINGLLLPDGVVAAASAVAAQVSLEGRIEAIEVGRWLVNGVPVYLNDGTPVNGNPQAGSRVRLVGVRRSDGGIRLAGLEVLDAVEITGEPAPIRTLEPTPGPTPQPSPTPAPSETPQMTEPTEATDTPPRVDPTTRPTDDDDDGSRTPKPTDDDDDDHRTPKPTDDDDDHHDGTRTPEPNDD